LDGATVAAIYLGDITQWNDPQIKRLNPKLTLPARRSRRCTVRTAPARISCSPTTCPSRARSSSRASAPIRRCNGRLGIGAKGNEGVANMTTQTDGAIGYVEYAYAKQNKMAYTLLTNKAGAPWRAERRVVSGGRRQCRLGPCGLYYLILTDQAGAKSWPITGASFILRVQAAGDPAPVNEALKFFAWAYKDGASMAAELDYVPLARAPDRAGEEDLDLGDHVGRPSGVERQ
jgi:phosphate transport system substrate-binding protein